VNEPATIWRTEMVTLASGEPAELAIRADIEVPERKLAVTWSLRRNTDKSLPATHLVEINFKLTADFPSGGISNVPGMLMKQGQQTRGVTLAGLAVKVTLRPASISSAYPISLRTGNAIFNS
jgi:hypothetical protein